MTSEPEPTTENRGGLARDELVLRSEVLGLLLDVTNGLNTGWDVEEILDAVFQEFRRILPYERMEYAIVIDEGHTLRTAWTRASYASTAVPRGYTYRRADNVATSGRYREAFLSNDLESYAKHRPPDHPVSLLAAEGVKSALNCPLVIGTEVKGYLFFNTRRKNTYTPTHLALIELIGGQLATILEHGRLNDQLREANQELRGMKQAQLEFVATISHELRTPISSIVGFASVMQDRIEELGRKELIEFTSIIATQSSEVAGLLEDLLVITRAETGHLALDLQQVSLSAEVASVLRTTRYEREDQTTTIDLAEVSIWADPLRVRQITRNLLSNAGRYGGPEIRVATSAVDDHATLVVSDNGDGIPSHDHERIFQRYSRARAAAGDPASIGLGLAVSRHLAEAMGGNLTYERDTGDTRFVLRLQTGRRGPA